MLLIIAINVVFAVIVVGGEAALIGRAIWVSRAAAPQPPRHPARARSSSARRLVTARG